MEQEDEWFAIRFPKRKCERETSKRQNEENCQVKWQEAIDDIHQPGSSNEIHELFDGERAEDFIFDIDELWNLESHENENIEYLSSNLEKQITSNIKQ